MSTLDLQSWDIASNDPASNKEELYNQIKNALQESETPEKLWRMSKVCVYLAKIAETEKKHHVERQKSFEGLMFGEKAINADPACGEAYKWYLAAIGLVSKFVSTKEKIKLGNTFKIYADKAIQILPYDYLIHYMYGRWCFDVASLSWLEKRIASTFFSSPPSATYDDALNLFIKSDALKPNWKENYYWIARTYQAKKQKNQAREWADKGLALPIRDNTDVYIHNYLNELRSKL